MEERANVLKQQLKEAVDKHGVEDERGHKYLKIPCSITVGEAQYGRFKNERRNRKSFNENRAWDFLSDKNLLDKCTRTVKVIDQDALFASLYDGDITEDELDSLFDVTTYYAFEPVA